MLDRAASTGDGLPGDNRFDKVILVRDKVRVLLVDGTPNAGQTRPRPASHFVRNALTPVPENRDRGVLHRPAGRDGRPRSARRSLADTSTWCTC